MIGFDPAKTRGTDHDADHNFEHDGWKPDPREEAKRQRGDQPNRDDNEQVGGHER